MDLREICCGGGVDPVRSGQGLVAGSYKYGYDMWVLALRTYLFGWFVGWLVNRSDSQSVSHLVQNMLRLSAKHGL
jgi:hypothetical protein